MIDAQPLKESDMVPHALAVAERLGLAQATGTPPIVLARLESDLRRRPGRDNRLGHVAFPVAAAFSSGWVTTVSPA